MTVQSFSSPSGIQYAVIDPGSDSHSLNLTCTVDRLKHLSTTVELPDPSWEVRIHHLDQNENDCPFVNYVNYLIELQAKNILRICEKHNLQVEGEGIARCRNFKHLVSSKQFNPENLDLSGLNLDCLPFHLGLCKNITTLDLSNNSLRVLSKGLLYLERLKVIDLKGNPILELPAWVNQWIKEKGIKVVIERGKSQAEDSTERDSDDENKTPHKRLKGDLFATQPQDYLLALINN